MLTVESVRGCFRMKVGRQTLAQGLLLGRYDRCDSSGRDIFEILCDRNISRVHLVLVEIAGTVYAIDTASTNGVWVGKTAVRLTPLESGSVFTLGGDLARLTWASES
jgi:pSer/pThr/pTyr-binding forkhead associated (FHA) protein